MCARFAQFLLAALFVFVVATVAAFRYLTWWQAILASAATFFSLIFLARYLLLSALGNMAKGLFEIKSRVLRGATAQIHTVRPIDPPAELVDDVRNAHDHPDEHDEPLIDLRELSWYEIEATIFPGGTSASPRSHWNLDDLRLVSATAPPASFTELGGTIESPLYRQRIIVNGQPVEPDGPNFHGPQRLRFVAGLPRDVRRAKFRYYVEDFGMIDLPHALPR